MAAIIVKIEHDEQQSVLYQEAEGLLNDNSQQAWRSTLGADTAMRYSALNGYSWQLRHNTYRPAEFAATSSMDMAPEGCRHLPHEAR
jgi:hypothetical protein